MRERSAWAGEASSKPGWGRRPSQAKLKHFFLQGGFWHILIVTCSAQLSQALDYPGSQPSWLLIQEIWKPWATRAQTLSPGVPLAPARERVPGTGLGPGQTPEETNKRYSQSRCAISVHISGHITDLMMKLTWMFHQNVHLAIYGCHLITILRNFKSVIKEKNHLLTPPKLTSMSKSAPLGFRTDPGQQDMWATLRNSDSKGLQLLP